jgi:hypothetical protein
VANSGWTADPDEITVPASAGPGEPYVYLGQNDQLAQDEGVDAAMTLHFGDDSAFIIGVTQENVNPNIGHLVISGVSGLPGALNYEVIFVDYSPETDSFVQYFGAFNAGARTTLRGEDLDIDYSDGDGHDFRINGVSQPRGQAMPSTGRVSNSAAIGAAETVMLSLSGNLFKERAYRLRFTGSHDVSVANSDSVFRVRKTNELGQQLDGGRFAGRAAATSYRCDWETLFTCTNNLFGVTIVVTLQGSGAHNSRIIASAVTPCRVILEDIGAQADYPGVPVLV